MLAPTLSFIANINANQTTKSEIFLSGKCLFGIRISAVQIDVAVENETWSLLTISGDPHPFLCWHIKRRSRGGRRRRPWSNELDLSSYLFPFATPISCWAATDVQHVIRSGCFSNEQHINVGVSTLIKSLRSLMSWFFSLCTSCHWLSTFHVTHLHACVMKQGYNNEEEWRKKKSSFFLRCVLCMFFFLLLVCPSEERRCVLEVLEQCAQPHDLVCVCELVPSSLVIVRRHWSTSWPRLSTSEHRHLSPLGNSSLEQIKWTKKKHQFVILEALYSNQRRVTLRISKAPSVERQARRRFFCHYRRYSFVNGDLSWTRRVCYHLDRYSLIWISQHTALASEREMTRDSIED